MAVQFNGQRYGQLPVSKHFPIKVHQTILRSENLRPTLKWQLTIALVKVWCLLPALGHCGSAITWQSLIVLLISVEITMIPVDLLKFYPRIVGCGVAFESQKLYRLTDLSGDHYYPYVFVFFTLNYNLIVFYTQSYNRLPLKVLK